jgi:hypothetical protein
VLGGWFGMTDVRFVCPICEGKRRNGVILYTAGGWRHAEALYYAELHMRACAVRQATIDKGKAS